jgi:hypothetical protein
MIGTRCRRKGYEDATGEERMPLLSADRVVLEDAARTTVRRLSAFAIVVSIAWASACAQSPVEVVQNWRPHPDHGDLAWTKDETRGVLSFRGGRGWRGGYVDPELDLSKYKFANIGIRNLTGRPTSVSIELKHERIQLLHGKRLIALPADDSWHVVKIELPGDIRHPLNYLALSDPGGPFELSSVAFSN